MVYLLCGQNVILLGFKVLFTGLIVEEGGGGVRF